MSFSAFFVRRMGSGQLRRQHPPACLHSGSGGQAFEAISVERATAGIGISLQVMRNADVTHLGVQETVNDFSIHHRAAANTGADRQVKDVRNAAPGTPAGFTGELFTPAQDAGVEEQVGVARLHATIARNVEVPAAFRGDDTDVLAAGLRALARAARRGAARRRRHGAGPDSSERARSGPGH